MLHVDSLYMIYSTSKSGYQYYMHVWSEIDLFVSIFCSFLVYLHHHVIFKLFIGGGPHDSDNCFVLMGVSLAIIHVGLLPSYVIIINYVGLYCLMVK